MIYYISKEPLIHKGFAVFTKLTKQRGLNLNVG